MESDNNKRAKLTTEEEEDSQRVTPLVMEKPRSIRDPIARIQDSFVQLGDIYVAALRQCFQGLVGTEEVEVDGAVIDKTIQDVLDLINSLPDSAQQQDKFQELVKRDTELDSELSTLKDQAEEAVRRIKTLRVDIANKVLM